VENYQPAGVVHKGEYVIPGPVYPKRWWRHLIPRRCRARLLDRIYPDVYAQWKTHLEIIRKFNNKKED
jgi:hypothetical protein